MEIWALIDYVLLTLLLAIETVSAAPLGRSDNVEHKQSKRNFVPNRFDIIDNEIKHAIQKEVQNALRKNFVPNNPLLEDKKWGKSSPAQYPVNQPSMIYGMEYDEINPSRSDPGYLVLDLKQLSQGRLKFHEQQIGNQGKLAKTKAKPKPQEKQQDQQQNMQSPYYAQPQNYGQYSQYQPYYNGYQPNTQQYQQHGYQNYQQQQQPNNNAAYPAQTNPQYSQYPTHG